MYYIHELSILRKFNMSRSRFLVTVDNVCKLKLTSHVIYRIYINIVHSTVCCTEVLIISCHLNAAYVRSEATLSDITPALVEYFITDSAKGSVLVNLKDSNLAIMIACYEEELVLIACRQIASTHTIDCRVTKNCKASILLNLICLNAEICNRVQIFPVMRNCHI